MKIFKGIGNTSENEEDVLCIPNIGDRVYVNGWFGTAIEHIVSFVRVEVTGSGSRIWIEANDTINGYSNIGFWLSNIGVFVFFSKEEAEEAARLAKEKGQNGLIPED